MLANVPKTAGPMVASIIRTIFAQPDTEHVFAQFDEVVRMLTRSHPKIAGMLESARTDLLAFAEFPSPHWRQINLGLKPGFAFAAKEQLVLYAVLTVYQDMDLRWVDGHWRGIDHHLRHAFAYANDLKRSGVARVLLERIAERSITPQPLPENRLLPATFEAVPRSLRRMIVASPKRLTGTFGRRRCLTRPCPWTPSSSATNHASNSRPLRLAVGLRRTHRAHPRLSMVHTGRGAAR